MGYNSLDKERKSKKVHGTPEKKEKAEKELMGVYAYDDGGNVRTRCTGTDAGVGVWNDCDTGVWNK